MAGTTKLPYGQKPLMLYGGEMACQTLSGKVKLLEGFLKLHLTFMLLKIVNNGNKNIT